MERGWSGLRGVGKAIQGPWLIAAAALIWATDSLVRARAAAELDPTFVVFCEHLICVVLLLPWVIYRYGRSAFRLTRSDWFSVALIGAGASALATVFFTQSFQNINPSVSILLQKLQPVFVVIFASAFLREKPKRGFYFWSVAALIAATGVSFPGYDLNFLREGFNPTSLGVAQALAAASLWAVATVIGRALLKHLQPDLTAFWRFAFGLLALSVFLFFNPARISPLGLPMTGALLYMGVFPGITAMILYYRGLARTPASVATFVELLFPISAVCLNAVFLSAPLSASQIGAGLVLILSITRISFLV